MVMVLAIIVTYNGEKYIDDCVKSLIAQTRKVDILLVDNASSDDTCNIVRNKYPEIKIIDIGYNSGFAHANNTGMQYAIDKGYEYVMLINEDTVSDRFLVEKLIKAADENTAVIPKIYMNGLLSKVWYGAGKIDFENCIAINCQEEFIEQMMEVSFMTGCCMLIHTGILRRVGMFDEDFFMYYEDTDLSLRFYENNIRMIYIPDTFVWHRVQGKIGKGYYAYYMERNWLLFLKKHVKTFHCSITQIVIKELYHIIFTPDIYTVAFKKYKLKGIIDFIANKTGMMKD